MVEREVASMNIDIQSCAFMATEAPADHARRRLRFVMARHGERIERILVKLGEMNGTFGPHGKYCRIQVDLVDAPPVVSLDTGADFDDVIDRAVDRAGRAALKHLRRTRVATAEPGFASTEHSAR
jgi:hypothetical protein